MQSLGDRSAWVKDARQLVHVVRAGAPTTGPSGAVWVVAGHHGGLLRFMRISVAGYPFRGAAGALVVPKEERVD